MSRMSVLFLFVSEQNYCFERKRMFEDVNRMENSNVAFLWIFALFSISVFVRKTVRVFLCEMSALNILAVCSG